MKKSELRQIIKEEIQKVLNEVGEGTSQIYKWEEISSDEWNTYVRFTTESETEYQVDLEYFKSSFSFAKDLPGFALQFTAKLKGEYEFSNTVITNKGEMYRVMATIVNIVQHYLKNNKIITYTPEKKKEEKFGKKRDSLYKAFITKKFPNAEFKQIGEMIITILPNN
jgi:hypothetical protein